MRSSVIQRPKDAAGTYRCVAVNTLGSDNKTEKLQSVGELLVSGFNTETIANTQVDYSDIVGLLF